MERNHGSFSIFLKYMTFYIDKVLYYHYLVFSKHYHPSLLRLFVFGFDELLKIHTWLFVISAFSFFFSFWWTFLMESFCIFRQCWSGDSMWQVFPCVMPKHCWSRWFWYYQDFARWSLRDLQLITTVLN